MSCFKKLFWNSHVCSWSWSSMSWEFHWDLQAANKHSFITHINTDSEDYTLRDSDEEILFFSETKYFLFITDDATWKCWIYFLKEKSDFFDVLIFFFNYLKNLDIQFSVILRSDWTEEILSIRVQKLLKNNRTKWKLSVSHIQHQNRIFKHDIQTICR